MFAYFSKNGCSATDAGVYYYLSFLFYRERAEWIEISLVKCAEYFGMTRREFLVHFNRVKKLGLVEVVKCKNEPDTLSVRMMYPPFKRDKIKRKAVSDYYVEEGETMAIELKDESMRRTYEAIKAKKMLRGEEKEKSVA